MKQYNLNARAKGDFVYLEIRRAIYGLSQAAILANKQLHTKILPANYYEVAHTPGLWRHVSQPVHCTMYRGDFSIKYASKQHLDHSISTTKKARYGVEIDTIDLLYCGVTLNGTTNNGAWICPCQYRSRRD